MLPAIDIPKIDLNNLRRLRPDTKPLKACSGFRKNRTTRASSKKSLLSVFSEETCATKPSTNDTVNTKKITPSLGNIPSLGEIPSLGSIPDLNLDVVMKSLDDINKFNSAPNRLKSMKALQIPRRTPFKPKLPTITGHLEQLKAARQKDAVNFEQKLRSMDEIKEEQDAMESSQGMNGLGLDRNLPKHVKEIIFQKEEAETIDQIKPLMLESRPTRCSSMAPAQKNLSRATTRSLASNGRGGKPKKVLPTNEEKYAILQSMGVVTKAKDLADEVVKNFKAFQEEVATKSGAYRQKIWNLLSEVGVAQIFAEKNPLALSLDIRIYMDMIKLSNSDQSRIPTNLPEVPLLVGGECASLNLLGYPELSEKRYYIYIRVKNELESVNLQYKSDKIDSLRENLIDAYKSFIDKKSSLFDRLRREDYGKLKEVYAQCEKFESSIPIYEPDGYLKKIERFELCRGEFDGVQSDTRVINNKISNLLENWNACISEYN